VLKNPKALCTSATYNKYQMVAIECIQVQKQAEKRSMIAWNSVNTGEHPAAAT
jgi:hypothetical protein